MPVTPEYAIAHSPAARLSDEERETYKKLAAKIDELLTTEWPGTPFSIRAPHFYTAKVAAHLQRKYSEQRWQIQMQPLDGALGSAAELLAGGATLQWEITLAPDWRR
jgi:hypothetical protein